MCRAAAFGRRLLRSAHMRLWLRLASGRAPLRMTAPYRYSLIRMILVLRRHLLGEPHRQGVAAVIRDIGDRNPCCALLVEQNVGDHMLVVEHRSGESAEQTSIVGPHWHGAAGDAQVGDIALHGALLSPNLRPG